MIKFVPIGLFHSTRFKCLVFLSFSLVTGCYYDVEEELYPGDCSTSGVSYSGTVVPMLQSNGCLGCHTAPAAGGGFKVLDNYNGVLAVVGDSVFVSGADRMPPGSGTGVLSSCDITKLKAWVAAGAPNN